MESNRSKRTDFLYVLHDNLSDAAFVCNTKIDVAIAMLL